MEKLLIIEDDLVFCKLLSAYLNKNGFIAEQASNAEQAMEMLDAGEYDVAIIDYRLPGANGLDLFRWMKERQLRTKAILMSRVMDSALINESIQEGAMSYLEKPFHPGDLLRVLEKL